MAESPWTLTRLELLYYHRRHKRWQIWQEATKFPETGVYSASAPGELHRAQIFSLLETVRASLNEVKGKARFSVDSPSRVGKFRIEEKGLRTVLLKEHKFWLDYLQYVSATAIEYGIPGNSELHDFVNNEAVKNLWPGDIQPPLQRAAALDLISMLPVLRHWDLQGCWFRAVSQHATNGDCWVPNLEPDTQPFYMAALTAGEAGKRKEGEPQLVEKPICVELIYEDLRAFDSRTRRWNPKPHGPADFFDCCYKPTSGNELLLYQCYAFLFDKLFHMLNPGNDDFFIAYPVKVLGRLNFLHLWLRRDGASLNDLRQFWFAEKDGDPSQSPHFIVWSNIQEFLKVNLRSIAHSTFQAVWQKRMVTAPEPGQPIPKPLEFSLCECAHLLMPLDWIKWTDLRTKEEGGGGVREAVWGYEPYSWEQGTGASHLADVLSSDSESGSLGMKWVGKHCSATPSTKRGEIIGEITTGSYRIDFAIRPSSIPDPHQSVSLGEVRLAVQQQLALGETFKKQQEAIHNAVKSWILSRIEQYCSMRENRTKFKTDGMDSLKFKADLRNAGPIVSEEILRLCGLEPTFEALVEKVGGQTLIETLMAQMDPFHMSLYLETGPVPALTHPGEDYWDSAKRPLAEALAELEPKSCIGYDDGWTVDLSKLHTLATNAATLTKIDPRNGRLNDRSLRSELKKLHDIVRCEHRDGNPGPFLNAKAYPLAIDDRFYPFRPCAPVIAQLGPELAEAIRGYMKEGTCEVYSGAIRGENIDDVTKPGYEHTRPWHSVNIFATRYQSRLPSTLRDLLRSAEVRRLGESCEEFGDLLVGLHCDGTTIAQKVGEDDPPMRIEEFFKRPIPHLSCGPGEVFFALVIKTVRLD